jgi:hypothetical protein
VDQEILPERRSAGESMIEKDPQLAVRPAARPSDARYPIAEELARNGPIRVMAAHDRLLNRRVALATCYGTSAQRLAFAHQGQAVAGLTSDFLVDIYDCGSYEGRPFVVLERPAYTLLQVVTAGGRDSVASFDPTEAARELEAAIAFLRRAGVEFGELRPEAIGLNEAGHVRLSPWPFCNPARGEQHLPAAERLSDRDRISALLAPVGWAAGPTATPSLFSQPGVASGPAPPLAGLVDHTSAVEPSNLTSTAQIKLDPTMLSRRNFASRITGRHRSHFLAAAAAAVAAAVIAFAALGTFGSVRGQASAPGAKSHASAARTATPNSARSSIAGSPDSNNPANDGSASQLMPMAAQQSQALLVTPATAVSSAPDVVAAPGLPTASTTTTAPQSTTTTVPVTTTTTTTTVPATTTTVAPPSGP